MQQQEGRRLCCGLQAYRVRPRRRSPPPPLAAAAAWLWLLSAVPLRPLPHIIPACQVVNLKYMKKSARDEARAAFKQQHKAVKRAQLDPDTAKTTLELQKEAAAKQAAQQAANGAAESDDDSEGGGSDSGSDGEGGERQQQQQPGRDGLQVGQLAIASKPASREELRERLQKKLEVRGTTDDRGRGKGWAGRCPCSLCHPLLMP